MTQLGGSSCVVLARSLLCITICGHASAVISYKWFRVLWGNKKTTAVHIHFSFLERRPRDDLPNRRIVKGDSVRLHLYFVTSVSYQASDSEREAWAYLSLSEGLGSMFAEKFDYEPSSDLRP